MSWSENIKLSKLSISYYRAKANRRCVLLFLIVAISTGLYAYLNYLEVAKLDEVSKGNSQDIKRLTKTNQEALNYNGVIQTYEAKLAKIEGFLTKEIDVISLVNQIVSAKPESMTINQISLQHSATLTSKIPFIISLDGVTTDLESVEPYKEAINEILGNDNKLETTASKLAGYDYNYSIESNTTP